MWDFVRNTKDSAVAAGARRYINSKLGGMGEMTEFSIDTKTKAVRVRLELLGESQPIELHVTKYSLKQKGGETHITVEEATASREWMTVALREFVIGKSFLLPSGAGTVLKLLV
jgi:hypothetical protein